MSEIKAGDLVMVIRTHCNADPLSGAVRTVSELYPEIPTEGEWLCQCGAVIHGGVFARLGNGRYQWEPLSWLKKINPPAEPEAEVYREARSTPVSEPEFAVSK